MLALAYLLSTVIFLSSPAFGALLEDNSRVLAQDEDKPVLPSTDDVAELPVPADTEAQMHRVAFFFTKITSPCSQDQIAFQNSYQGTTNGCGAQQWHNHLSKIMPYDERMTPCCNQHDLCFSRCATLNFEEAYTACNTVFRTCMHKQCIPLLEKQGWSGFKRRKETALCKVTAQTFYHLADKFGKGPYNNAQKKHCDCF